VVVNDRWDRTAKWVTEIGKATRLQADETFRPAAQVARVRVREPYLVCATYTIGQAAHRA